MPCLWRAIAYSSKYSILFLQNEKGTVAYLTVELDDAIGGDSVQTRVVQNKEPHHFLELFKGKYIVHKVHDITQRAPICELAHSMFLSFSMSSAI